ncbi:hypothetical protein J5N97_007810 [Dioscorea zingiberensis]|uniref:Glycoside hydrolase family 5 domain-containing protein n=1 Tax=Dioscorea zingiberensis TaxID=325984 RepID=A0A9D5DDY5_9LILI|nr:hypothetical protein J5N97_007810 [Dioscorea zingiberensis]
MNCEPHASQRNHPNPRTNMLILLSLLLFLNPSTLLAESTALPAFPLSTSSRWIVDAEGRRVKLACGNWAAHMEAVVAEGLGKQRLEAISESVASMGFNCVRLTWPTDLLTDPSLASLTVRRSLLRFGLIEAAAGVQANNPEIMDLTLFQAFQAVVSSLARNNIMVILDNQITKPGWCCSKLDGNGFFGDKYFDPEEWLEALTKMATLFRGSTNVVGMSLRNELRGPNQTLDGWYKYMQRGAEAVHSANPEIIVILSGLDYDKDLSFLSVKQVELPFTNKLVFELHWYGFSDGQDWQNGNPNEACGNATRGFMRKGGFLLKEGWPLFLSEFGVDVMGNSLTDNRFLSCFLSVAAELDMDWAIWALQGSYYHREGQLDFDETYGVFSHDWSKARNERFVQRLVAIQKPFQGPGISNIAPYHIIFHPLSGLCIRKKSSLKLELGPCSLSDAWNYTLEHDIVEKSTGFCLQVEDTGKLAKLGTYCSNSSSKWELISDSKMHIASKMTLNRGAVCLDVSPEGLLVTNLCKCLRRDGTCSPESQWFKIISSTRDEAGESTQINLLPNGTLNSYTPFISRRKQL